MAVATSSWPGTGSSLGSASFANAGPTWQSHSQNVHGQQTESSFGGTRAQRGRGPARPSTWVPSQRKLRKYASLFLRSDANADGYVEASEAHDLCLRSGLGEATLRALWAHADQDRDGRLTFREFIVLVHLITCCLQGFEVPPLEQGVPPELRSAVAALYESPRELDAQRSSSPGSSRSSASSASPSWAGGSPRASSPARTRPPAFGNDFDATSRRDRVRDASCSEGSDAASSTSSPRFGSDMQSRSHAKPPDLKLLRTHLTAVLEADRTLARHMRGEADQLEARAAEAGEVAGHVASEVRRSADEAARFAELQHQLNMQVMYAKRRLTDICTSRRNASQSLIAADHHRQHIQDEKALLQQTLQEEEQMLVETLNSNDALMESCQSLRRDVEDLERESKVVLEQTVAENDFLHRERHRNVEMAGSSERLGEGFGDVRGSRPTGHAIDSFVAPAALGLHSTAAPGEPFAWASSLVSSLPTTGSRAAGNWQGKSPLDREGV